MAPLRMETAGVDNLPAHWWRSTPETEQTGGTTKLRSCSTYIGFATQLFFQRIQKKERDRRGLVCVFAHALKLFTFFVWYFCSGGVQCIRCFEGV